MKLLRSSQKGQRGMVGIVVGIIMAVIIITVATSFLPAILQIQRGMSLSEAFNLLARENYVAWAASGLTPGEVTYADGNGGLVGDSGLTYDAATSLLSTRTGRTATYVVAASDTPAAAKNQADYVLGDTITLSGISDLLAVNGTHVGLQNGTYAITSPLVIVGDDVTLSGSGWGTKLVRSDAADDYVITVSDPAGSADNVVIRDLYIDGNAVNQTVADAVGIYFNLASNVLLDRVAVVDVGAPGVGAYGLQRTGNATNIRFTNGLLSNSGAGGGSNGVDVDHSVLDDVFIGVYLASLTDSIITTRHSGVYPTSNSKVTNNEFYAVAGTDVAAVSVEYENTWPISGVVIANNYIDFTGANSGLGIGVTPNNDNADVSGVKIIGNTITNTVASSGIAVGVHPDKTPVTVVGTIIDDNWIENAGTYAIRIYANNVGQRPSDTFIGAGNKFSGSGTANIYDEGNNTTVEVDPGREFVRTWSPANTYGFSTAVVDTGTVDGKDYLQLTTGVNASSSARTWAHLNFDDVGFTADYDKPYTVTWTVSRQASVATAVTYLKIDAASTVTDPADKSIGFRIDNLAIKGLAHTGGALDVVDLSTNMVSSTVYEFTVKHVPAVGDFYFVDGLYKGISTGEPAGTLYNGEQISQGILNGVTASNAILNVHQIIVRRDK